MGSRLRTTRASLSLLMGAALIVTIVLVNSARSEADPGDPRKRLACGNDRIVTGILTHDSTTVESRSPAQLAAAYTNAVASGRPAMTGKRDTVYESDTRTDITVTNAGETVAVLTFERHDSLGWRLQSVFECA